MSGLRSLLLLGCAALAPQYLLASPEALFYMTNKPDSIRSFLAHANQVDVLVPAWYSVDANGLVWGGPDPFVMQTAKQAHVPVMPIVANAGFDQEEFHKLATNRAAYENMIAALLRECEQNGYTGFQFDFEHISWTDRDALTNLVRQAAAEFHQRGLKLSIATVPNAPGHPGATASDKWAYANWRGGYDLKAIAANVDLISLMTYDEHTQGSPPGPVSGYAWTVTNLDYALKTVPKEKLSLGIPLYGKRWYSGVQGANSQPSETAASISGRDVQLLIKTYHPQVQWDPTDKVSWFYFYPDMTREWVFYTDRRTFQARWDLVNARGIEGFSAWVLGAEDPGIWQVLP